MDKINESSYEAIKKTVYEAAKKSTCGAVFYGRMPMFPDVVLAVAEEKLKYPVVPIVNWEDYYTALTGDFIAEGKLRSVMIDYLHKKMPEKYERLFQGPLVNVYEVSKDVPFANQLREALAEINKTADNEKGVEDFFKNLFTTSKQDYIRCGYHGEDDDGKGVENFFKNLFTTSKQDYIRCGYHGEDDDGIVCKIGSEFNIWLRDPAALDNETDWKLITTHTEKPNKIDEVLIKHFGNYTTSYLAFVAINWRNETINSPLELPSFSPQFKKYI